jgi:SAM-dependent methyltransferase
METLADFYAGRFFAPRTNVLAMQLEWLPMRGRILSLCCGHGVFENLLAASGSSCKIVSIDDQFLNLLATRHYTNPGGNYVCHDLQMPLPFRDQYFDGVFSSTCLPEIPTQRSLVAESIRVTREVGWTLFDSIWTSALGPRIDPLRFYRFAQNLFSRFSDYVQFFSENLPNGRDMAVNIPTSPADYLDSSGWISGMKRIEEAVKQSLDLMLSVLVTKKDHLAKMHSRKRPGWLSPRTLSISPAFSVRSKSRKLIELQSRPWLTNKEAQRWPSTPFTFCGYPSTETLNIDALMDPEVMLQTFCRDLLVVLPDAFGDGPRRLSDFL